MSESSYSAPASVSSAQRMALIVGVVGLVVCGLGYAADHHQFMRSYLMAFVFWVGIGLGSMALAMIAHLSGGAWGVVARRIFEASSRTVPLMAVLFLPVALGLKDLYLWAQPEAVAADPILQHKEPYLNVGFFLARTLLYFAIWTGMAWALSTWSRRQDEGADTGLRMQRLSGGGLLVYAITVFFMSVDWIMSLDPHWFSTIYGMLFMVGQGLSALAFTIAVVVLLARTEPFAHVIGPNHLHDLGKLTFAFVMLWAYLTFSQFLIVWSANLPEEIPWYLTRMQHGWGWIGLLLIFGHFFLPFFILLNRDIKRNGRLLLGVAVFILVIRFVDIFWLIGPPHGQEGMVVHWLDVAAPIGLGGVVVAWFLWQLAQVPLIPVREPYLQEAVEHGRGHH
jgi:hypothetical protein